MGLHKGVTVATRGGPYSVAAEDVVGPFAIHRSWGIAGWTVTHIATGYAADQCLQDKETAMRLAAALIPLADWSFSTPGEVWNWSRYRRDRIKAVIRGFKRDDKLGRFAPSKRKPRPTPEAKET